MGAGQMRDKVTFQRLADGVGDGAGNFGSSFVSLAGATGIAASIDVPRGSELVNAQGVQGRMLYEIRIRYTATAAGITVGDRVIDARDPSRMFNVRSPGENRDGHKKYLTFLVELGGAAG